MPTCYKAQALDTITREPVGMELEAEDFVHDENAGQKMIPPEKVEANSLWDVKERVKLSHKKWRRLWKKEKRRLYRQQKRKEFDRLEEEERKKNGLITREAIEAEEKQNEWLLHLQEVKRQKLHEEWLTKEKAAQEEFEKKKSEEDRRRQERLDQESRIKEEWEAQQKREQRGKVRKEKAAKEREENLNQELEKSGILKSSNEDNEEPWHNPIAAQSANNPELYGTEKDPNYCSFYLKTGACRFGERCSRQHPRPPVSQTLLIPNMFQDVRLMEVMLDEKDNDVELEFDEDELNHNFKEFYKDVLEEFRNIGQVQQFKVCCNFEPHLRGNVYVQYKSEDDAMSAFAQFNGRWYAGKQLSVQFSPVNKWRSAICGTFAKNRCPRGRNCNFLHVFRNPNNEFRDADRDMWRSPTRSHAHSEREWRSSTRELERRWERAESCSSERSRYSRESRRRDYSRRRRRSRSTSTERRRSRPRSREKSTSSNHSHRRPPPKTRHGSKDKTRGRRQSKSQSPDRRRVGNPKSRDRARLESSSDSEGNSHNEGKISGSGRESSLRRRFRKENTLRASNKRKSDDEFVPEFDSD